MKSKGKFVANHDGSFSLEGADITPGYDKVVIKKKKQRSPFQTLIDMMLHIKKNNVKLRDLTKTFESCKGTVLKIPKIK